MAARAAKLARAARPVAQVPVGLPEKAGAAGTSIDAGGTGGTSVDASLDSAGDVQPDATSDASTGDGGAACSGGPGMGLTCANYCDDWFSTCQPIAMWSMTYADPAACLSACATWADAKLCCRTEHVRNAVNSRRHE